MITAYQAYERTQERPPENTWVIVSRRGVKWFAVIRPRPQGGLEYVLLRKVGSSLTA